LAPQTFPSGQVAPIATHAGGAHVPLVQTPDAQSEAAPQTFPSGHADAIVTQEGGAHLPPVQTPDAQSDPAPHPAPSAHVGVHADAPHLPPVQTPDSQSDAAPQGLPFGQVDVIVTQEGGAHMPELEQTPDWQSEFALHPLLSAHAGHMLPPQSTLVSSPFCTPSVQLGAEQLCVVVLQTCDAQLALLVHGEPVPQFAVHAPFESPFASAPPPFASAPPPFASAPPPFASAAPSLWRTTAESVLPPSAQALPVHVVEDDDPLHAVPRPRSPRNVRPKALSRADRGKAMRESFRCGGAYR
jgi:hypothetical protein